MIQRINFIILVSEKEKRTKIKGFSEFMCRVEYIHNCIIRFPTSFDVDTRIAGNTLPYNISYCTRDELKETKFEEMSQKEIILFVEGDSTSISNDGVKDKIIQEICMLAEQKIISIKESFVFFGEEVENFFQPIKIAQNDLVNITNAKQFEKKLNKSLNEYRREFENTISDCLEMGCSTVIFDKKIYSKIEKKYENVFLGDDNNPSDLVKSVLNQMNFSYDSHNDCIEEGVKLPNNRVMDPLTYIINKDSGLYDYNVRNVVDDYALQHEFTKRELRLKKNVPRIISKYFIKKGKKS